MITVMTEKSSYESINNEDLQSAKYLIVLTNILRFEKTVAHYGTHNFASPCYKAVHHSYTFRIDEVFKLSLKTF